MLFFSGNIHELHHVGNGGVETQFFRISGHSTNKFMQRPFERHGGSIVVSNELSRSEKTPNFLQKTLTTDDAIGLPRLGSFQRPHEHLVKTQRILLPTEQ